MNFRYILHPGGKNDCQFYLPSLVARLSLQIFFPSLILLSCLCLLPVAACDDDPIDASAQDDLKNLIVKVVDEEGNPVEGVRFYVSFISQDQESQKKKPVIRFSNEQGLVKLPVFPKLRLYRVWASRENYVTLFFNWEKYDIDSIPSEFKIILQKGTKLGGVVVDADGNPVEGAKLDISLSAGGTKVDPQSRVKLNTWLAEGEDRAVSDKNGVWSINNAPPGDDLKLRFMIEHPEFIKDEKRRDLIEYDVKLSQLRSGSAEFKLTKGVPIRGKITDAEGKPVTKGLVIWGDNPYRETGSQEVEIDENGNYRIPPRSTGKLRVTVV